MLPLKKRNLSSTYSVDMTKDMVSSVMQLPSSEPLKPFLKTKRRKLNKATHATSSMQNEPNLIDEASEATDINFDEIPSDLTAAIDYIGGLVRIRNLNIPRIVCIFALFATFRLWYHDNIVCFLFLQESHIQSGHLRKFRLNLNPPEFGLLKLSEYFEQIDEAKEAFEKTWGPVRLVKNGVTVNGECEVRSDVFDRYREFIRNYFDVSVSKSVLLRDLGASEFDIRELVKSGFLVLRDADSFYFSIRSAALFTTPFLKGRKAVLRMVKRKKYKEIFVSQYLSIPIRDSSLDHRFHMYDLVGSGRMEKSRTTMGWLLRLTKKGEIDAK
ncbi:serine-threonine protein kinase 19-domain-containing protein [Paraphysoderma sedebokerense]|nr:serine-threonine protein kinase 19-domain-containing protein [Paraphysoderma sedebokerense]